MTQKNKADLGFRDNPPPKAWQIALGATVLIALLATSGWMIYSTSHQFIASPSTPGSIDEKFAPSGIPSPNPAPPVSPVHPSPALPARIAPIPAVPPAILRDRHHLLTVKMRPAAIPWQRLAGATKMQRIASAAIPWHPAKPAASLPAYATVPWKRLETQPQTGKLATVPWQRSNSALTERAVPLSSASVPWKSSPPVIAANVMQSATIPWQPTAGNAKKQGLALAGLPWQRSTSAQAGPSVSLATVPWRSASPSAVALQPLVSASLPWRRFDSEKVPVTVLCAVVPWQRASGDLSAVAVSASAIPWKRNASAPIQAVVPWADLMSYQPPLHAYGPPHEVPFRAPPRWYGDAIPSEPLSILGRSNPKNSELRSWLREWTAKPPQPTTRPNVADQRLSDLLARASLDCPTLYRLGMTIAYIDGDKAALPWFQGAVASAERETKPAAATLEALSQLGGRLFNAPDFATSIRCYTILAARAVPGTPDARRFQFMLADSYVENGYNEGRPGIFKGLEIVLGWMKSEDFEQLSEVDQAQLHWLAANMYFRAGRYAESLPYFEEALKQEKVASWPSWTRKLYCVALARAGRIEDAKAQQAIWMDLKHPTELDTGFVKQVIRQAELNNAARQAASPNHERKE